MSDATADMSLQESCIDAARHLSVEVHLLASKADELERENARLREFASESFSMAFNFYHGAGTAEDLRELKVEYHELGIEVDV